MYHQAKLEPTIYIHLYPFMILTTHVSHYWGYHIAKHTLPIQQRRPRAGEAHQRPLDAPRPLSLDRIRSTVHFMFKKMKTHWEFWDGLGCLGCWWNGLECWLGMVLAWTGSQITSRCVWHLVPKQA